MKNSLFKRAFAAATVVPLALTQCLSVANAANVNNATIALTQPSVTATEVSIERLAFIEPTAGISMDGDGYERIGDVFVKDSDWNVQINGLLNTMDKTGVVNPEAAYEWIISRAGKYADIAKSATEKIGDFTYNISSNGNIVLTATAENITPVFEEKAQSMVGAELKNIAEKYDIPELADVKFFDGIEIAGDIRIDIDASSLKNDTVVSGKISFTDKATGTVYTDDAVLDYMLGKINELQNSADSVINELVEEYGHLTDAELENLFHDLQGTLNDIVSKAKSGIAKSLNQYTNIKNLVGEYSFANYAEMAEAINNSQIFNKALDYVDKNAPSVGNKIPDKIPTDADAIASNSFVQKVFASLINQLAAKAPGYSVQITPEDIAQFTESFTDIKISANSGVITYVGKLPDEDLSNDGVDAATYITNTYDVTVGDVYKEATVVLDFTSLDTAGSASVDFQLKRVVEVEDVVTTTSTTSTTVTTGTETTTTDDSATTTTDDSATTTDDSATTTTTDDSATTTTDDSATTTTDDSATTTTDDSATTTTDDSATTTTDDSATTTTDDSATTTTDDSATTTTDDSATTTTDDSATTTTDDSATTTTDDSATTTTDDSATTTDDSATTTDDSATTTTDDISGSTTTTVSEEHTVNITVETVDGFYLTIDEEFNKKQIKSLAYTVDTKYTTIGEDGEVINEETVEGSASGEITYDMITFNDTPASTFIVSAGAMKFNYDVAICAAEDIVAENGAVIAAKGDVLTSTDGTEATIPVYIGVKGDADLDGMATSTDASTILAWYGKMSTGGDPENTIFSTSNLIVDDETGELLDEKLDQFAAFLADVDNDNAVNNALLLKADRSINSADASFVLAAYSASSTGKQPSREVWNDILGEEYAKK